MNTFRASAALLLSLILAAGAAAAEKRAKTDDGREVILRDDGTWSYLEKEPKEKSHAGPAKEFHKDKKSLLAYEGKRGTFALYLIPDTWKQTKTPPNPVAEVGFVHKDGDVYGMVIAERANVSLEALKKVVVKNWKRADPHAQVVIDEMRKVNGRDVLCMTAKLTAQGIPFVFYGYYFTGDTGSYQVIAWTAANVFEQAKPDIEAFLNGFTLVQK